MKGEDSSARWRLIDFWVKWRKYDFTTAARELAETVL